MAFCLPSKSRRVAQTDPFWLPMCVVALSCCADADTEPATPWCTTPHESYQAAHADTNYLKQALSTQLGSMMADGRLKGKGIWQRGALRRKGHDDSVALYDDADERIVDGYRYDAYLLPPRPHVARAADDRCPRSETWPACEGLSAHTDVALERVGGIAATTWRSDTLIASWQLGRLVLCACPPSTFTERLPLCCSLICCL